MKLDILLKKREAYLANQHRMAGAVRANYDAHFSVLFAHNSTAIEGNTLSILETKLLLEDKLSIGGKPLREIYEVVNHGKAFDYVRQCVDEGKPLGEDIAHDIHALLMENILPGGIYRDVEVRISGARHVPPPLSEAYRQMKFFFADMPEKSRALDPLSFAAWTHAEFVRIHPFVDGNGRTARLIMNFQLLSAGFLPVSIAKEDRLTYFDALEAYAVEGLLSPFAEMIAALAEEQLDQYLAGIPAAE